MVVDILLHEVRAAGLSAACIQKLLTPDPRSGFYGWAEFSKACDAAVELAGGHAQFAALVEATILGAIPHVVGLAPVFGCATTFAQFAVESMDATAFVGLRYTCSKPEPDRLLVRLAGAPSWQAGPSLMMGALGALRQLVAPLGHGTATVVPLGGLSSGVLEVRIPRSAAGCAKPLTSAERALFGMMRNVRQDLEQRHQLAALLAAQPERGEGQVSRPAELFAIRARRRWNLTPTEVDVLTCVCSGLSNKEIGAALSRAESTIELHMTRILKKTGARNRALLVALYFQP